MLQQYTGKVELIWTSGAVLAWQMSIYGHSAATGVGGLPISRYILSGTCRICGLLFWF